jgi:hypothetical protein
MRRIEAIVSKIEKKKNVYIDFYFKFPFKKKQVELL